MESHTRCSCLWLLLLVLAVPTVLAAHGGGLDSLGCHHDRKKGGYHCHRGALAGRSFASQADALKALEGLKRAEQPPAESPPGARRGELLIEATRVDVLDSLPADVEGGTPRQATSGHHFVVVHVRVENRGKKPAKPEQLVPCLKTTFNLEHRRWFGMGYESDPEFELLPGEESGGRYVFEVKSQLKPLEFLLDPAPSSCGLERGGGASRRALRISLEGL